MTNKEFQSYCENGNIEQVKLGLIDPNVDPSADTNHAIGYSSRNG